MKGNERNSINSFSSDFDEIAPYSKKRVVLNVDLTNRPLFGVISKYDSKFVVLEKKDGQIQTIRRRAILSIDSPREVA